MDKHCIDCGRDAEKNCKKCGLPICNRCIRAKGEQLCDDCYFEDDWDDDNSDGNCQV